MLIGLTGGIGSGKSTLAAELARRDYPVYCSDTEAKRIIVENPMVRSQIELLFGSEVYEGDRYCTEQVAKVVFRHPDMLERLNAIVHPAVAYDLRQWTRHQEAKYCFVESAILYESGLNQACDKVVCVVAPEAVRVERTLVRDYTAPYSQEDRKAVWARIHAQMSDSERVQRADIVVENDGTSSIADLAEQVLHKL